MSEICVDYLPPKEHLPECIYAFPELRYPCRCNLAKIFLDENVKQRGDKVAVYYRDEKMTYRELREKVNKLSNGLKELGVEKNDRVILRSPNVPEYIISNFACWRIGAIPVLVNHLNRAEEIAFKANDSEAVAMICHSDFLNEVEKVSDELKTVQFRIVVGEKTPGYIPFEEIMEGKPAHAVTADTTRDDFGRLIYSSGTTGKPKGIITTNAGLLAVCDSHARHVLKVREDDVLGGHPYFTFAFGSVNFTLYPWRFGASLSIIERFRSEDMFETIEKHRITLLCCVPTAFRMMLGVEKAENKYDLSSLRLGQSAGEWLPVSTYEEWKQRFGIEILDSLGSGDLNYWLSTHEGLPEHKVGSTGLPVPGVENKIVDENFNEVPRGTRGELIVRGPSGQTYWRRPDKQKEGVCGGWNRPGLIFMEDVDGYFWYQGRADDMIVTAGYKIAAGEVEGALYGHPAVLECAVVDSPHFERGAIVKGFVVLKDGYQPSCELIKELQDFTKERIEPYKYPREIEFVDAESLPRTSTGKIQRYVLREMEKKKYAEKQERGSGHGRD